MKKYNFDTFFDIENVVLMPFFNFDFFNSNIVF